VGADGHVLVEVLGPLRAWREGEDVTPRGELQRRLLAALVLHRGRLVSTDALLDALWPSGAPRKAGAALQTHVFRLRQLLPDGAVSSDSRGYRLDAAAVAVDADLLAGAVASASAERAADPAGVAERLREALEGWRGSPYPELADTDDGLAEAGRLEELRTRAEEERAQALVELHRGNEVLADLARLVDAHPLRERPVDLLMRALAQDGRIGDALRAYDDFRRRLDDELGITPSASLAGLEAELLQGGLPSGPVRAERADTSPPVRTTARTRGADLPVPLTSLVGRERLVESATALADRHRLVTLLGTGGVGKTRLAIEVAHRLLAARRDRPVVLCELAGATPASAVEAVATLLRVETRAGVPLEDRIASVLRNTELVLLLDNCEHVLEPIAGFVEHVLARTTAVTVLATSQERLRLPGEQLCPVPPLPEPAGGTGPAVDLFVERARAVRPDWEPDDHERTIISEIVHRLDGLPLAIELAAARVHTLEIAEVATGLDRRFRLLTAGSRSNPRHRSLHAAVAWSYDLLDDDSQRFLASLSVFAAPFTVVDTAAVAGVDDATAHDTLSALTERSLVVRAGDGRYVVLETLRAFGAEEVRAHGRIEEVGNRHAARLLARVEAAIERFSGDDGEDVLDELDDVLPDLRVAVDWMIEHGDAVAASRLVVLLEDFGFYRLRGEVLGWADRIRTIDPEGRNPQSASAAATAALGAWARGDSLTMLRETERALELASRDGLEPTVVVATMAGNIGLFDGRLDEAATWYRRAKDVADNRADTVTAHACEVLAYAYGDDPVLAARAADDLLAYVGGWRSASAGFAWYAAGEAVLRSEPDLARARFATAIELAEATGSPFVAGTAGASAVSIEARSGDPLLAAADYRRLIELWRRAGMWATQWTMLRTVACLLERLDRNREAAVLAGAVTATPVGYSVFGDDAVALEALAVRLRDRLGDDEYLAATSEGAAMDGEAAVEHALLALVGAGSPPT